MDIRDNVEINDEIHEPIVDQVGCERTQAHKESLNKKKKKSCFVSNTKIFVNFELVSQG